jgi:hypothetical protein
MYLNLLIKKTCMYLNLLIKKTCMYLNLFTKEAQYNYHNKSG